MPADVAMQTSFVHLEQQKESFRNTEDMSGDMTLLRHKGGDQPVQVIVYRTSVDHFAVIYHQEKVSRPLAVLNLRNTTIERLDNQNFMVRQGGCDTPVALTFHLDNPNDIESWIVAFSARSSTQTHHSNLPIVEEEEI